MWKEPEYLLSVYCGTHEPASDKEETQCELGTGYLVSKEDFKDLNEFLKLSERSSRISRCVTIKLYSEMFGIGRSIAFLKFGVAKLQKPRLI